MLRSSFAASKSAHKAIISDKSSSCSMGGSPGELSEDLLTYEKRKKGWRMNCDVGEATEGLENEL